LSRPREAAAGLLTIGEQSGPFRIFTLMRIFAYKTYSNNMGVIIQFNTTLYQISFVSFTQFTKTKQETIDLQYCYCKQLIYG